jgi:hypothetical protein
LFHPRKKAPRLTACYVAVPSLLVESGAGSPRKASGRLPLTKPPKPQPFTLKDFARARARESGERAARERRESGERAARERRESGERERNALQKFNGEGASAGLSHRRHRQYGFRQRLWGWNVGATAGMNVRSATHRGLMAAYDAQKRGGSASLISPRCLAVLALACGGSARPRTRADFGGLVMTFRHSCYDCSRDLPLF